MRWIPKQGPNYGDMRVITKFLWFPCCPTSEKEWRWLETASIDQVYLDLAPGSFRTFGWVSYKWHEEETPK